MSAYESNVSVYAEQDTKSLILVFDGQEYIIDQDHAGDFLNAVFDACVLIKAVEFMNKKGLQ